ncbi:MAG TPA: tRNA-dihydrouridine synthase [Candidatus Saccharimonadales bacterium]|nr:tRNA-dihydrouridine synthase [Candidatus Saccharimonadales bacterium]
MSFIDELPRPFFILAPMDDVTDTVFRQIVADCAKPDLFFTEFVNVDGLQSPGRERLLHKLLLSDKEKPVIAQLWGLKPENFYKTTKELIGMGYSGVDLNMGCPVKTVTKNGACAALINNRQLAGEIIDATKEAAGDSLPVSVKTRVGFTTIDMGWIEFLLSKKILNMLSIHGRTAKQMSKVPANWELIGQARELRDSLSPSTLIVGNGDVDSRRQGEELAAKYGLDGIMIGRGIFHDPFVFAQNSPWESWNKQQKLELFRNHIKLYIQTYKNNERRFEALRKFCKVYINGFDGAADLRAEFMETSTPQQALELLV